MSSFNTMPAIPMPSYGVVQSAGQFTASLASTVFFTAAVPGLYLITSMVHVVSTDGSGTLTCTAVYGRFASITQTATAVATDTGIAARLVWLNAGDNCSLTVTAAGLTGTVYEPFLSAVRVL